MNNTPQLYAKDRVAWRAWLKKNHRKVDNIQLVLHKKNSEKKSVTYAEAVEESLCFGWIDSKPTKRDETTYLLFFSKRKAKSVWSKVNKGRIIRLIQEGRMTKEGLLKIEEAKSDGSWEKLDAIEELIMPPRLEKAFNQNKKALLNFTKFPPSVRKGIYQWIISAKTEITIAKRVHETVEKAALNVRANQWSPRT